MFVPRVSLFPSDFVSDIFSRPGAHKSQMPVIDFMEHLLMRIKLTASAAWTPVNGERLFEQINIYDPTNPSKPFQVHYDDFAVASLHAQTGVGSQKAIYKTSGIESQGDARYGTARQLPAGVSYYYVPIMSSLFANLGGVFVGDMRNRLELEVIVPSTIVASGSPTITAEIQFCIEGRLLNEGDRIHYRSEYASKAVECRFLMPHRTRKQITLTAASQDNYLELPDIRGACASQMLLIRQVGQTNANNGRAKLFNLGDSNDARIELVDAQGNSITGSIPTQLLRTHQAAEHFGNDWVVNKPVYFLNYCKSLPAALKGAVKGGRYFFPNSGVRIRFTLPAAPVAEVQTVTMSGTAAAGSYRIKWGDEETLDLAFGTSAANMAVAVNAFRGLAAHNVTVAFSASVSAGTSFTATFTDPEGWLDGRTLEIIPGDALAVSVSSVARTTAGIAGLASGTYEVDCYSLMYREGSFSGQQFDSRELALPPPEHAQ